MKTVAVEDISMSIGDWLGQRQVETVVITRGGQPVALLAPLDDQDPEVQALRNSSEFWQVIKESRARTKLEGSLTISEACAELGIPLDDVTTPTGKSHLDHSNISPI